MTSPAQPLDAARLQALRADADARPQDIAARMTLGAALHQAGQPEHALVVFEQARALAPGDLDAVSACATVLFELARPQAAYDALDTLREQLIRTADGAANLAIAAEACGRLDEAKDLYAQALALEPDHLRALNNCALIAAQEGRWADALPLAARCVQKAPGEPQLWLNHADVLLAARDYSTACDVLAEATERFPDVAPLQLRRFIALAFNARFAESDAVLQKLGAEGPALLRDYLKAAGSGHTTVKRPEAALPTARELFAYQAFEAIQQCDWRYNDEVTRVLRDMLARAEQSGDNRDWRTMQFYALVLDMHEDEAGRMRRMTGLAIRAALAGTVRPFSPPRVPARDGRLRIGLLVQSLADARTRNALARQLALHDSSRFAIHVYAPTPRPQAWMSDELRPFAASVTEIAHMTVPEAVARIRLDQLDLVMDSTFYTPWCRPEIAASRVAPVQIGQMTWQRHEPQQAYKYCMSDVFVHPDEHDPAHHGVICRLPHTCWLATNDDQPEPGLGRADAGLPEGALVLSAFVPTVMIDPASFGAWMAALRALPDAVLMFPGFTGATRDNLTRAATQAGVDANRLVFSGRGSRPETLARLALADLFLDPLRFNANHSLADSLRLGVPAVTCAGYSMASRLGGSVVRAAGLADCVTGSAQAYVDLIVTLGRDPARRADLRRRLAAPRADAPFFDVAGRVKDWEAAWMHMLERERAGLPSASFDVARAG
jgi:predicted O-linked N-acetylglucosamine transferase (SPINDLY family)